jgi:hypothetical protein
MKRLLMAALAAAIALPCAAQPPPGTVWRTGLELDLPGDPGTLRAEFVRSKLEVKGSPVVIILPGSGPTDRDGNNSYGVRTDAYRMLSEGLAEQGVTSLRPDKRGMFSSADAAANANQVFVDALAADANLWAAEARARTGAPCAWLAGHSEGALVALIAAQTGKDICGLILIAGPGRPLGAVIREQLQANPGNAPYLDEAFRVLSELEAGRKADISRLPPAFGSIFHPAIQDYMINLLAKDPARLAAAYGGPILILQGTTDLQVGLEDAKALEAAQPSAKLVLLDGVNHVLKTAPADRAANMAAYSDPKLPLADGVVAAVADFIKVHPGTN